GELDAIRVFRADRGEARDPLGRELDQAHDVRPLAPDESFEVLVPGVVPQHIGHQHAEPLRRAPVSPDRVDGRAPERLRVLMANVLWDNTRYEDLERLIRRERPDIVGLVELTPEWVAGLAAIGAEYPYRVELA